MAFVTEEALLLQSQIAALQPPRNNQLKIVRDYFRGPDSFDGRYTRKLGGLDYFRLDPGNKEDLVALKPPAEDDLLSRILQRHGWFRVRSPYCHDALFAWSD